jgi:hypothetical protein
MEGGQVGFNRQALAGVMAARNGAVRACSILRHGRATRNGSGSAPAISHRMT